MLQSGRFLQTSEINQRDNQLPINWTTNSAPPRTLNLTEMNSSTGMIDIRHSKMLKAVISMCPLLTVIMFHGYSSPLLDGGNFGNPRQLQSMLSSQLPQVRNVFFEYVPGEYLEAVLSSLGGQLTELDLSQCINLLPSQLAPCTQLEKLDIVNCEFKPLSNSIQIDDVTLPNLKKLTCVTCLGQSSLLLEKLLMPLLAELLIGCVHFGIVGASNMTWDDVPRLYPNLKDLNLSNPCKSLTLEKLRQITTQLPFLESIALPQEMLESDIEKQLGDELITELEQRKFPIQLEFVGDEEDDEEGEPLVDTKCCYN